MSNQQINNLDALINRISYELVAQKILDENEINKLLGVLASNDVYAMWVWAKSQKDINEKKLFHKLLEVIKFVKRKEQDENFENYFQLISEDIHNLLFLKQILEKVLTFARYHAKALGD